MTAIQQQVMQELDGLPEAYGEYILDMVRGLRMRFAPRAPVNQPLPARASKRRVSEMTPEEAEQALSLARETWQRETAGLKPSEKFWGCLALSRAEVDAWHEDIRQGREDRSARERQMSV